MKYIFNQKQYSHIYYINNKESIKEKRKIYLLKNKEHTQKQTKLYRQTHKKQLRQKQIEYKPQHNKNCKNYRLKNPTQIKDWRKNNRGKMHKISNRQQAKRRNLGFIELNNWFEGSEAHHIDKECVVYIPKKLHRSIYHNIYTGYNMAEINDKVFEWLGFS